MIASNKTKILMVGAFPLRSTKKIYGGQVAACMRLMESSFVADHAVRTLDSTIISQPTPTFVVRMVFAVKRLFQFGWEIIIHRPDVVIFFLAGAASACEKGLMAWIARCLRIRVIVFPRAGALLRTYSENRLFASFIRHTLGSVDMFLCQGKAFRTFAMENLGFTHESAPIIPNWTALEEHLAIGKNRVYEQISCVNLLFLGWLEASKGVFDLLEAVRRLHEEGCSFHLTLAGDGHALRDAMRFVEEKGLTDYVTFAGWVDDEAKIGLFRACDVFVLPSWSEGLPNAMIEAMSAGLACVVTNVGNISDYVTDGSEALIIDPHNHVRLTEAVKKLISNHSLRKHLGQAGHRLALTQFSLEPGAKRMSNAVSRLMTTPYGR